MQVRRGYLEAGGRLVHYRSCGTGPALVMLHDSPRSSRLHHQTMIALADHFKVVALDTPGYGNSAPLGLAEPTIPDFAAALGEALEALGLATAPLYATHTSAKIALALAVRGGRMARLVLDGLSLPEAPADDAFIAAYMRPFRIDDSGAYLAAEWTRTRDMLRWFPWFTPRPAARMAMADPDPAWLDAYVIDLMSAGPHYADAYAAAMRWQALPDLAAVRVPTVVMARSDDVLYSSLDRVPLADNPCLTVERLGPDRAAWLERVRALCRTPADAPASAPAPSPAPPAPAAPSAGYLDLPTGQLHWQRHPGADGAAPPVLALSAPTTLQAAAWAAALAPAATVLVPDLPGFGESDALPAALPGTAPHLAALLWADHCADALAALIAAEAGGRARVLASGVATPLALHLAARHPAAVAALVIDGLPPLDPAEAARFGAGLCPEIVTDPLGGSHLHRLWHLLRDGEVQWPWHDRGPAAARRLPPVIDGPALHRALVGVLKQPRAWGDAAGAALALDIAATAPRVTVPTTVLRPAGPAAADPAHAGAAALAALLPGARLVERPDDLAAAARLVAELELPAHG